MVKQEDYDINYFNGHLKNYTNKPSLFWKNRIKNIMGLISLKEGEKILDLGTGIGSICIEASKYGAKCTGIDYSEQSINIAKKNFKKYGNGEAEFIKADVSKLGFLKNKFDKIICADLIEHLSKETFNQMLKECRRLLSDNGFLFIYSPYPTHFIERIKSKGFMAIKDQTHIGLQNLLNIRKTLNQNSFKVFKLYFKPTHLPVLKTIESLFSRIPKFGDLFKRRICIIAVKE